MTDQKVAIITGSGRGMGAAIARKLNEQGYRLALMSPSDSARILADELGGIGLQGSTANSSDIAALVEAARDAYGRIDAVVNHTGGPPKAFRKSSASASRLMIRCAIRKRTAPASVNSTRRPRR